MLLQELEQRGLLKDVTKRVELENKLNSGSITLYCGFDPTADSLHVGSLLPLITLMRFRNAGHNPLALIGGATGLIGDPSGKSTERTLNSVETVDEFKLGISEQIKAITSCESVDNMSWASNLNIIDFLRDIGKEFTVNSMLAKESVKNRIEREDQGISFTEFSYMILQSMDFLKLFENKSCVLQIGGSDQWGNITGGTDLIRRKHGSESEAFGLTFPLLTKSDGTKFGKSESGNVWLSAKKTSPFKFFQFWLNVADADIEKMMLMLSFKPISEIRSIIEQDRAGKGKPQAQKILAEEMTQLVHGASGLESAKRITDALFNSNFESLTESDFEQLSTDGLDTFSVQSGTNIVDVLLLTQLAPSKRQSREFISNNAVSINGSKVSDLEFSLTKGNAFFERFAVIKRGKKAVSLAKVE